MSKKTRAAKEQESSNSQTQGSTHGMSKYARKKQMQAQAAARDAQRAAAEKVQEAQEAAEKARSKAAQRKAKQEQALARAEQALQDSGTAQLALKQQTFKSIQEIKQQAADEARAAALAKEYTGQEDGGVSLTQQTPNRLFTLVHKPIEQINTQTLQRRAVIRTLKREEKQVAQAEDTLVENAQTPKQPQNAEQTQAKVDATSPYDLANISTVATTAPSGVDTDTAQTSLPPQEQVTQNLDNANKVDSAQPSTRSHQGKDVSLARNILYPKNSTEPKKPLSLRPRSNTYQTPGYKPKVYNSTTEESRWDSAYRALNESNSNQEHNSAPNHGRVNNSTTTYRRGATRTYQAPNKEQSRDGRNNHGYRNQGRTYSRSVGRYNGPHESYASNRPENGTNVAPDQTATLRSNYTERTVALERNGYTERSSLTERTNYTERSTQGMRNTYPRTRPQNNSISRYARSEDGKTYTKIPYGREHEYRRGIPNNPATQGKEGEDTPSSKRAMRRMDRMRCRPFKGNDPFAKFTEEWSKRMDPSGLWNEALDAVRNVRHEVDGTAFMGVPAFLKFLEGTDKRKIVDEYAFEFKLFIRRFEVTNFINSMRSISDNWWNNRPNFDNNYSLVYFDSVPVRFRQEDKQVRVEHVLFMLGVTLNGRTDLLGCIPEFKTSSLDIKWWEDVLNYFKSLGMQHICYLVAGFKCRYLERALARIFPETTLQWNLLEALQFNSYALPSEVRKEFMSEAQALCDAPNFETATSLLDTMRQKWEPMMSNSEDFGDGILMGQIDLLERQTMLPPAMRVILNTHKPMGAACSLLFGKKDPRDHFSDYPEMLTYIFYRYVLLARHEWTQHIGETVCNLNFKQVFTQLRNLPCAGGKLLDKLLSQHQRNFLEKYFGRFGPGPVVSYQGRPNRMTVRLEPVQIEQNIWSEPASSSKSELVGKELTPDLSTNYMAVPSADPVSEVIAAGVTNAKEAVSASFINSPESTQLEELYRYTPNYTVSSTLSHELAPEESTKLVSSYTKFDAESLQQANSTTAENPYDNYQPLNAVPGMLKPSIASALKAELRYIRFQERTNSVWWLGGSSFSFDAINCIQHSISPIFKVALQKKHEKRKENENKLAKAEKKRKLERSHLNYLKRHHLIEEGEEGTSGISANLSQDNLAKTTVGSPLAIAES